VDSEDWVSKLLERSVIIYQSTRRNFLDEFHLINTAESPHVANQHCCDNLHISHINTAVRTSKSPTSTPLWEYQNLQHQYRCENLHISHINTAENLKVSQHIMITALINHDRKPGSATQNYRTERHLTSPTVLLAKWEAFRVLLNRKVVWIISLSNLYLQHS
jgi:hypothetical protein